MSNEEKERLIRMLIEGLEDDYQQKLVDTMNEALDKSTGRVDREDLQNKLDAMNKEIRENQDPEEWTPAEQALHILADLL